MIYAILLMILVSGGFFAGPDSNQAEKREKIAESAIGVPDDKSTRPLSLTQLFTPTRPQLGRYEVLTSPESLSSVIQAIGRPDWAAEAVAPLDAFGHAGSYDKPALARLYGGVRPLVARGWIQQNGRFESLTFISPYPDPSLTRLNPGTLTIRFIICCT
jgi:hypothetical protein